MSARIASSCARVPRTTSMVFAFGSGKMPMNTAVRPE